MKILQIIDSLRVGGAEVLLKDLCNAWHASGAEVTIYVLTGAESWIEKELRAGGIHIVWSGLSSRYSLWQVPRLAHHLRLNPYDVIHSHLFPAQLWVALAAGLAGIQTPLVTTEHNTWNRRRRLGFRSLDRFLYARYSAIVCISQAAAAGLERWLAPQPCSPLVIHNGIDTSRFLKPGQRQTGGLRNSAILLCVGTLCTRKNQAAIIRALTGISGAELLLVGEGPLRDDLKKLASSLGVERRVRFLGQRRDVAELLAQADVYIQPSLEDGFCLAVVEAMAAGLPVIASNVPGLSDVVGDGGMTFDLNTEGALAASINQLLHQDSKRAELARDAPKRAALFNVGQTAAEYWNLYCSLCGTPTQKNSLARLTAV